MKYCIFVSELFTILFALTLAASSVLASDEAVSEAARQIGISSELLEQQLRDCDANQMSMNICAQYKFVKSDVILNDSYKQLISAAADASTRARLVAAQRAWLKFRDLDCKYVGSGVEGGTMHAMIELDCKKNRTDERVIHLQAVLACKNPGCPGK